jgi:5-methylcytosine-specific restriction endonuclease McrA
VKPRKPIKRGKPPKRGAPPKRGGPIKKRSEKQSELYELRRPFVEKILSERPFCQACKVFAQHDEKATFIQNNSMDVHEIIRRSQGGSILDEENVLAVCRKCHTRIGNYPQLAFDLGLAKRSWEK